jgi:hypothetical protein
MRYDANWNDAMARKACTEAGFSGGRGFSSRVYGNGAVVIAVDTYHMMLDSTTTCDQSKTVIQCSKKESDTLSIRNAAAALCGIKGEEVFKF